MPRESTRQVVIEVESDLSDDELHEAVEKELRKNSYILQHEVVAIYRYDPISGCWFH